MCTLKVHYFTKMNPQFSICGRTVSNPNIDRRHWFQDLTWLAFSDSVSRWQNVSLTCLLGLLVGGLQSTWLSVSRTGTHTASPSLMSKSTRRLPRCRCRPCTIDTTLVSIYNLTPNYIWSFWYMTKKIVQVVKIKIAELGLAIQSYVLILGTH